MYEKLDRETIVRILRSHGESEKLLFAKSQEICAREVGNRVYFRGLVEFSNICSKDCFYCGIRKSNKNAARYTLSDVEILDACRFAYENRLGSVVLQSGEISNEAFAVRVGKLTEAIKKMSNGELGITLSCGEQSADTYKRWFDSGAHRYLLRIETSKETLYKKMHPDDGLHGFAQRIEALATLKKAGYQVGTGVMIGLPFQTCENLADDILFFKSLDIDMCGMGPYVEHGDTPLMQYSHLLSEKSERLLLTLRMIAALRIVMPDINIAASTALQSIDPQGREKALEAGANVIMPNLTPLSHKRKYCLYEGKPQLDDDMAAVTGSLTERIEAMGFEIGYGEWGDSKHFEKER